MKFVPLLHLRGPSERGNTLGAGAYRRLDGIYLRIDMNLYERK